MELEQMEEWLTPANERMLINLCRTSSSGDSIEPVHAEPFQPAFTYPIIGEDEVIFGYKKLSISLNFAAHDMRPALSFKHRGQFRAIGTTEAMDLTKMFAEFMREDHIENEEGLKSHLLGNDKLSEWKPPGDLVESYNRDGQRFEIWATDLSNERAKDLFSNMQILVPLYIEGGTLQQLDDPEWTMQRWILYLLYEVEGSTSNSTSNPNRCPYNLAGFSTTYRLWVFPAGSEPQSPPPTPPSLTTDASSPSSEDEEPAEDNLLPKPVTPCDPSCDYSTYEIPTLDHRTAPSRVRLSQFLILPPHQGASHGIALLRTITNAALSDASVLELTVEDPNESFDAMRDMVDLARLRRDPAFHALSLPADLPAAATLAPTAPIPTTSLLASTGALTRLRRASKTAPRQFARVLELHLLAGIPRLNRNLARQTRGAAAPGAHDRRFYFWRLCVKARIADRNWDLLKDLEREERVDKVEEAARAVLEEYEGLLERAARRGILDIGPEDAAEKGKGAKRRRVVVEDEDEDDEEREGKTPRVE